MKTLTIEEIPTLDVMKKYKHEPIKCPDGIVDLLGFVIVFEDDSYVQLTVDFSGEIDEEYPAIEIVYLGDTYYSSLDMSDYDKARSETIALVKKINKKVIETKFY